MLASKPDERPSAQASGVSPMSYLVGGKGMINNEASTTGLVPGGVCIDIVEQICGGFGGIPGNPMGK